MIERIEAAARLRVARLADALRETAEADLPAGVDVERVEGGVAFTGRGLARAIAFDGRLRGWAARIGGGGIGAGGIGGER